MGEMEQRHLIDAEEIEKMKKEISICRKTIEILKGGAKKEGEECNVNFEEDLKALEQVVQDKEDVIEAKNLRISELEDQLAKIKKQAQLQITESGRKALGLAVSYGHTLKMHDEALSKKV